MNHRSVSARREFIKQIGRVAVSVGAAPLLPCSLRGTAEAAEIAQSRAVRAGRAQHITILHTADIHAQLDVHDEFFWEQDKPVFKRRGGFATLRTMTNALPRGKSGNVLLIGG